MKSSRFSIIFVCLTCLSAAALSLAAQDPATPASPAKATTSVEGPSRLTIEVTAGDASQPVENASVYVKYIQEHAIKHDKKVELNVKTNREGVAHVPNAPVGRALVQIIADGWKTYGRWYDIADPRQVIKIHLEKPPKWY
ncbi:MAG TPA: carboxypeptidase-like regulatory domain-containing protein [Candidatus Methylomirabilis sp.]|nr:carboxypeptidase-like regulatory domain-containing protein [Candidatus Methylomirabilis sp.]